VKYFHSLLTVTFSPRGEIRIVCGRGEQQKKPPQPGQ
jgi:hypothetical protein